MGFINTIVKNKEIQKQLITFIIIGVGATAIDFGILALLLTTLSSHYLMASGIAFSAATIFNYLASTKWVFKSKYTNKIKEFIIFLTLSIVGLLLTQLFLYISVEIVGLTVLLAKLGVTGIVTVINFILRKKVLE